MTTRKTNAITVPKLSAEPTKRLAQLDALMKQVDDALIDAIVKARKMGATWNELTEDTGIAVSTLRRLHGKATGHVQTPRVKVVPEVAPVAEVAPKRTRRTTTKTEPVAPARTRRARKVA